MRKRRPTIPSHFLFCLIVLALAAPARGGERATSLDRASLVGLSLTEALGVLQSQGLPVVFNSHVVRPEMTVEVRPEGRWPREILDELLAPHGLTARESAGGRLVVVPAEPKAPMLAVTGLVRDARTGRPLTGAHVGIAGAEAVVPTDAEGHFRISNLEAGTYSLRVEREGYLAGSLAGLKLARSAQVIFALQPEPEASAEIVVLPSQLSLFREVASAPVSLDGDDALALPRLGNDLLRGLTLLPGIAGNEIAARTAIRGASPKETLLLLDGKELFEPYHLKDYGGALSIIAPEAVQRVDVMTGGFPAEYGGRIGGVINLTTVAIEGSPRTVLGTGTSYTHALRSGSGLNGKARWFGVGRLGTFDQAFLLDGRGERPDYWDFLARADYQVTDAALLSGHLLLSDDHLDFRQGDRDVGRQYQTRYRSGYSWLTLSATLGTRLFVESNASFGEVTRRREALETGGERDLDLDDARSLIENSLRQSWISQLDRRHTLKWGHETRQFEAGFDYRSAFENRGALATILSRPDSGSFLFADRFREEHHTLFVSDHFQPLPSVTVEAGLRFDKYTLTDRADVSPRLAIAYAPTPKSVFRFATGQYLQDQRLYELEVADGETQFRSTERAEQHVLGFERLLPDGLSLRLEAYRRTVSSPLPRYENLFEPVSPFPEIQDDRVRLEPERSEAEGVEVMLRRWGHRRLNGWIHYAYSHAGDRLDRSEVPRSIDQPHAAGFSIDYQIDQRWRLGLAWQYRTGWPTTALSGQPVPELGPLYGERQPDYHRLDLRIAREWALSRGLLGINLDLQNLYERENVRGYEFEAQQGVDGQVEIVRKPLNWAGLYPSVGLRWSF